MTRSIRGLAPLLAVVLSLLAAWTLAPARGGLAAGPAVVGTPPAVPSVDVLLGGSGRADLERRLAATRLPDDSVRDFATYAAWGREILANGFVAERPTGGGPSEPVSRHFTCLRCHNLEREDAVASRDDPEARLAYAEAGHADVWLVQGAGFHGIVNRTAFYTDHFAKYHDLCVPEGEPSWWTALVSKVCWPDGRTMAPASLTDAVQVCARYCSVGRYLAGWELDSVLAAFWARELTLDDLGYSPEKAQALARAVLDPHSNPAAREAARTEIRGRYLDRAYNTARGVPVAEDRGGGVVDVYADGERHVGDPDRGETVYEKSCVRCHGTSIEKESGPKLAKDAKEFFEMLANGEQALFGAYMPEFARERLSRRQSADIRAYLLEWGKGGK